MAYWGSPDWSRHCIPRYFDHNPIPDTTASDEFKTNAWESMRWLSRDSFNCITFSPKDKVEFYPPQWKRQDEIEDFPTGRQLIVGEGYFRENVPLMSGGQRHPISLKREPTFVAMLVPTRFRECLTGFVCIPRKSIPPSGWCSGSGSILDEVPECCAREHDAV